MKADAAGSADVRSTYPWALGGGRRGDGQRTRSTKRGRSDGRELESDSDLAVQQVEFCHFKQVDRDVAIP